jgi:hypothetical protein
MLGEEIEQLTKLSKDKLQKDRGSDEAKKIKAEEKARKKIQEASTKYLKENLKKTMAANKDKVEKLTEELAKKGEKNKDETLNRLEQENLKKAIVKQVLYSVVVGTTIVVITSRKNNTRKRDAKQAEKQSHRDNKNNIKYQNKGIND